MMLSNMQPTSSRSGLMLKNVPLTTNRITISDFGNQQWQSIVKQRIEDLIRLEEGWDGYNAAPVSFSTGMFAFRMLESICQRDTPAPQIVPGSSGDLQMEWHTNHGDLELWVRSPNNVHVSWTMSAEHDAEEVDLTNDFSVVSEWVREVTESKIAIAAAA